MKKICAQLIILLAFQWINAQTTIEKIEPPFWWSGMNNYQLQLLVYGKNLSNCQALLDSGGVKVKANHHPNNNYLIIYLDISGSAQPGVYRIKLTGGPAYQKYLNYELKVRQKGLAQKSGIRTSDAIYLLMPDRFSNADPSNDNITGMLEKADRNNPDGRHGGDLRGINNHLDYIKKMGFTAIWINPVLENNMPRHSYHGYAITDFYKVDPRFGTNEDYCKLVNNAHKQGIKVIMDMVFNHFGSSHPWMKDLPDSNWIHRWPEFTRSNYRAGVVTDPYKSEYDKTKMQKGWFDTTMPDFNQNDPFVSDYLIQNSLWWIEYAGLDAIRMDTYPYSDENFMRSWMQRIKQEYNNFSVIGECWLNSPPALSYWLQNSTLSTLNSQLTNVFDFPMCFAVQKAFNEDEGWETGTGRLYDLLSQDFLYSDPGKLVVFADNHDIDRMASMLKTKDNVKLAMAFLATVRGIPLFYYGSEIMMKGMANEGHGSIRKDFSGGWEKDTADAFNGINLSSDQLEVQKYLSKLLNWRLHNPAVQRGRLVHFIPEEGIYVYFRTLPNQAVMIAINNNDTSKLVETHRFKEIISSFKRFKDFENQQNTDIRNSITLPAKSCRIIELYQ